MIDILFNCLDALEEYLDNIQQTTEEGTNDNAELIKSLNDMLNKEEKEAKAEKEESRCCNSTCCREYFR